jgi:transketolase
MRDAVVRAITEVAERDPETVLITGDLGFGVLTGFAERLPGQFMNAGVAEQNMTALAAGMALEGFRVVTYSIGNFPTLRCLEQIRNDVCYHELDVTIVSVGGGFSYGQLGMSHFATEDLAIMRALPGMRVVAPSCPNSAFDLTHQALEAPGPSYIRVDKGTVDIPGSAGSCTLGEPRLLKEGRDAVVVAVGSVLAEALLAAERLEAKGVSIAVLEVHTLKPLHVASFTKHVQPFDKIVTLEEHVVQGGLGGLVCELVTDAALCGAEVKRLGLRDEYPTVVGDQAFLRRQYGMDADAVVFAVMSLLA